MCGRFASFIQLLQPLPTKPNYRKCFFEAILNVILAASMAVLDIGYFRGCFNIPNGMFNDVNEAGKEGFIV